MRSVSVNINGGGKPRTIKSTQGIVFDIDHLRFFNEGVKLLLSHLPTTNEGTILFPMTGNAPVIPACAAALNPDAKVVINEIDSHDHRMMSQTVGHYSNIDITLQSDLEEIKEGPVTAFFEVLKNTDRLLALDILERLSTVLPDGSEVYVVLAKNRQKDFVKKLKKVYKKGSIVGKTRDVSLYKAFTDKAFDKWTAREKVVEVDAIGATVSMATRPGVFSHGRVDTGGLALYDSVELKPGESMLELGCGAGLISLLTAARALKENLTEQNKIHMVDSCIRAVDSAQKNIDATGLKKLSCELTDKFESTKEFDVFVGNPPYYANHRIAEYFIVTAAKNLKPGGRLYLVSKHAEEMEELAEQYGFKVSSISRRGYDITIGILQ